MRAPPAMLASVMAVSMYAWACDDSEPGDPPSTADATPDAPMVDGTAGGDAPRTEDDATRGAMMMAGGAAKPTAGDAAGGAGEDAVMDGAAGAAGDGMDDGDSVFEPFGPDAYRWSTDKFTLEPGQERYLCFAKSIDEALVVNGYASKGGRFVHHLIFARTRQPEPEGFAECDVAFRSNWDQIYITGTGENRLEFPEDAGHVMAEGQQLLAQMHLLNSADTAVEGSVTIHMRRSTVANPRRVTAYIFGTAAVELPPAQRSQVVGTCPVFGRVNLIAGFPHMHTLGAAMRFEVGPSASELREVYTRDPFDFDDQHIDGLELEIPAGSTTRVTCTFENYRDQAVGYGESTLDEMCYFVGFAVDTSGGACLEVIPPNVFGR